MAPRTARAGGRRYGKRSAMDEVLIDAAAGPAARWLRTLADCRKTPDEARRLLHAAVDRAADHLVADRDASD